MEHRMNSMEEDMLKMEMDETLKQAEAALDQIQKSSRKKKRVWIVELAPQTEAQIGRAHV